jgi:hypothetical protein
LNTFSPKAARPRALPCSTPSTLEGRFELTHEPFPRADLLAHAAPFQ